MSKKGSRLYASHAHRDLLNYIVKYRKLRGRASMKTVVEQLILAYAKQLASGMPEKIWRQNILALINECEIEHEARYQREKEKHETITKLAEKHEAQ